MLTNAQRWAFFVSMAADAGGKAPKRDYGCNMLLRLGRKAGMVRVFVLIFLIFTLRNLLV